MEIAISIKQAGCALSQRVYILNQLTRIIQPLIKTQRFRGYGMHGFVVLSVSVLTVFSGQMNDYTATNAGRILEGEANGSSEISTYIAADMAESLNLNLAERVGVDAQAVDYRQPLSASGDHLPNVSAVTTDNTSRDDIFEYTVQNGDNVEGIAEQFALSGETIRWNNELASNENVSEGDTLVVLPLDGVLHTVESGDTGQSLAEHYGGDPALIVSFNDAEIEGFQPGQEIVIPDGVLPESERPSSVPEQQTAQQSTNTATASNFTPQHSGGNGYAYGWCTWYVADRINIPNNWGNAATWAARAEASGYTVTSEPQSGAIAQRSGGWGGLGHVGIVEEVRGDEILMSDMNGFAGWGRVGTGTAPTSQYVYIIP